MENLEACINNVSEACNIFDLWFKYTEECVKNHQRYCTTKKRLVTQGSTTEPKYRVAQRVSSVMRESMNFSNVTSSRIDVDVSRLGRPARKAAAKARSGFSAAFSSTTAKLRRPTNFDSKLGGISVLSPIAQSLDSSESQLTYMLPTSPGGTSKQIDADEVFKKPTAPSANLAKTIRCSKRSKIKREKSPLATALKIETMNGTNESCEGTEISLNSVAEPIKSEAQRKHTVIISKMEVEVEPMETQNEEDILLCVPVKEEVQRSSPKTNSPQNGARGASCSPKEAQRSRTKTIRKRKSGAEPADTHNEGELILCAPEQEEVQRSKRLSSGAGDSTEPQAKRFAKDTIVNPSVTNITAENRLLPNSAVQYSAPRTRSKAKTANSQRRSKSAEPGAAKNKNAPTVPANSLLTLVNSFRKPNLPFGSPVGVNLAKPLQTSNRITPKDPLKLKLGESKKKEEDALKKKKELISLKKQEIRLNREMKVKKVAESRLAVEKEKLLQAEREKKEKEEKEKQLKAEMLKQREENQLRKKQLNQQKALEVEERRQKEEALRKARLKEIEEEQRKAEEAKRKQMEEAERLANLRKAQEKEEEIARLIKQKEKEKAQMKAKLGNSTVEQLDIDALEEMNDEEGSKLPVASWGTRLAAALDVQSLVDVALIFDFFGPMPRTPDLEAIFGNNVKRRPRSSSAFWSSPPSVHKNSSRYGLPR